MKNKKMLIISLIIITLILIRLLKDQNPFLRALSCLISILYIIVLIKEMRFYYD